MKTTFYFSALISLVVIACSDKINNDLEKAQHSTHNKQMNGPVIDSTYFDDLNLDGYPDTLFVTTTLSSQTDTLRSREGLFHNQIRFSAEWPDLALENSIRVVVVKAGDLNFDGNSELLIATGSFIGLQKQAFLYTLKDDSWQIAAQVQCRVNGSASPEELRDLLIQKNGKWNLQGILTEKNDKPYAVPAEL